MATSGASGLPDNLPGVYHHTLWVTMDSNGPLIANLLADGVLEKNDIRSFSKDPVTLDGNSPNAADINNLIEKYRKQMK